VPFTHPAHNIRPGLDFLSASKGQVKTVNRELPGTRPCGSASLFVVVDQCNGCFGTGERAGQVDRQRGLADAALRVGHGYYMR
jgi:hypothetical protein